MNDTTNKQNTTDVTDAVPLESLAPREAWVQSLGALGHEAARRRRALSVLNGGLSRAGRWAVPAALTLAAASWVLSARFARQAQDPPSVFMAASDSELRNAIVLSLENH